MFRHELAMGECLEVVTRLPAGGRGSPQENFTLSHYDFITEIINVKFFIVTKTVSNIKL
jgi:hypothetical protein